MAEDVAAMPERAFAQYLARLKREEKDIAELDHVSGQVCRNILKALCEANPEFHHQARICLWEYGRLQDALSHDSPEDALRRPNVFQVKTGTKRKADESVPELRTCKKCGWGFLDEFNKSGEACCSHPGSLVVDPTSSTWVGWEEDDHGPKDSEENRKLWPKGFRWDCCDDAGDEREGCQNEWHEPVPTKKQRVSEAMATWRQRKSILKFRKTDKSAGPVDLAAE
ncbi:hypothetical protein CONLIGDRAFT_343301 [Coniochaeta ligniaria NRRL 30616]|uniref:Uncharacterized protein n=1 Tax=Coniochaeta ligniaria NRRL 30616 TaxID=1408157 RepID=A0A1J7IRA8_9PEZI|nr:hypothetical protein CONLIGDRAFT_343301 [Coniochaeta ligniaria NRRL 30616]